MQRSERGLPVSALPAGNCSPSLALAHGPCATLLAGSSIGPGRRRAAVGGGDCNLRRRFLLVRAQAVGGRIGGKTPSPRQRHAAERFDWWRGGLAPASERATGSGWGQSGAGRADSRTAGIGSMDPAPGASYRRRLLLLSPVPPASPAVVKSLFPDELSPVSDLRLTMEQLGRRSVKAHHPPAPH